MTINEIIEQWREDSQFSREALDSESLRIPQLHAKYLRILSEARRKVKKLQIEKKTLWNVLHDYYRGDLDITEIKDMGREPYQKIVAKSEVQRFIETDSEYVEATLKQANYEELVEVVSEILKNINNRGFQIKSAVDFLRMTKFGDM